jgi:hypothetical protein
MLDHPISLASSDKVSSIFFIIILAVSTTSGDFNFDLSRFLSSNHSTSSQAATLTI